MNDFLKNLRSGQDNQTSRYKNKPYSQVNRQFPGNEKRIGIERRSEKHYKQHSKEVLAEMLFELSPAIKVFLESIAENQKRLVEVEEIRARAEEKKSKSFDDLLEFLKSEGLEKLMSSRETAGKKRKAKKPIDANRKKIM
jgi:antitoxin component of RelBE/YafQ-DinJ toxin-antitoxin module